MGKCRFISIIAGSLIQGEVNVRGRLVSAGDFRSLSPLTALEFRLTRLAWTYARNQKFLASGLLPG